MKAKVCLLGKEFILDTAAPNGGIAEWHNFVEFVSEQHQPSRPVIDSFVIEELYRTGKGWWGLLCYIHPSNFYVDVTVELIK